MRRWSGAVEYHCVMRNFGSLPAATHPLLLNVARQLPARHGCLALFSVLCTATAAPTSHPLHGLSV